MKKLFIAVAALAVALAGCASMSGGASGIEVLQSGAHSAMKDQTYKDFHNQADLDAFLATAFDKGEVPKITVDWTKQMVLAGFIGQQKRTNYLVRFTSVDETGDQVQVHTKIVIPCSTKSREDNKQMPFSIVAVPASSKPVNFNDPEQDFQKC